MRVYFFVFKANRDMIIYLKDHMLKAFSVQGANLEPRPHRGFAPGPH